LTLETEGRPQVGGSLQHHCPVCSGPGINLYRGLTDRLYSAKGSWLLSRCTRGDCGHVWLNPAPLPADIGEAYADYYTHRLPPIRRGWLQSAFDAAKRGYLANHFSYGGVAVWQRLLGCAVWLYPGRASELNFSVMWLPGRKTGRVLDVGAGSGWLVAHLKSLGWDAEGLDFDPVAVEAARANGLKMHQGDLLEQRFADNSYDAITMSHFIEHIHAPADILAEANRLLKKGGTLAIATPNSASLGHRIFRASWFALDPPRHLHLFNRRSLERVLRSAGFQRFRVFSSIRDANGAFLGSCAIARDGRYDMHKRPTRVQQIAGRIAQIGELAVKGLNRDAGEDLVAIAEK
jgi:2-polyprenyl-3-methyl-5-hydroxy-6-metoxy-1,4-benzoquinol methylase